MSTHTPLSYCATCQHELDNATGTTHDAQPTPGDLSICLYCGQIHTYDKGLRLVALPPEEFSLLPIETQAEIRHAIHAIHNLHKRNTQ